MENGLNQYILFHVVYFNLSHKDLKVNDSFIGVIRVEYQSIFEYGSGMMQLNRGKIQKHLGMALDYTTVGQVKITILDYIDEILDAFDKSYPTGVSTNSSAAPAIIFKVNKYFFKLNAKQNMEFHHLVAEILYATKCARLDTCTAISFLTTKVREPDNDDWYKLVHLMKHIRGTRNLPLILSFNGSGILKWWINGSCTVHPNMRGNTGGGLSMGRGFPIFGPTK